MSKILIVILALALSSASASIAQTACQYIVGDLAVFSFFGFGVQNISTSDGELFTFNLCNTKLSPCDDSNVTGYVTALVNASLSDDSNLIDPGCRNIADTTAPVPTLIDSSDAEAGIVLTFPALADNDATNIFVVNLTCDATIPIANIVWTTTEPVIDSNGNTVYTIQGSGAPGCPVLTLERYLAFFIKYKAVFAAAFLIIGLFALLAGFQFFNVTIFVFTAVGVAVALFVILFGFAAIKTSLAVQWVLFVLCCLVGLGCGYGAIKLEKVGFFVLGAFLGGLGGLFLYSFVLHFFQLSEVVLYIIIGVLALIGGGLSLWLWKDIIILATSCIGAYLLVRGASFYIGGFPNEMAVAEGLQTYNYVAYAYLVMIVIVAIGGMIFQFKRKRRAEENERDIYDEDSITREKLLR